MLARPIILRCTAFFLMLVFAQKSWAGLFVHNLLHISSSTKESPVNQTGQEIGVNYNCTCVDEFLMPIDEEVAPFYYCPALVPLEKIIFFNDELPYITVIFSSLRGPPAYIA